MSSLTPTLPPQPPHTTRDTQSFWSTNPIVLVLSLKGPDAFWPLYSSSMNANLNALVRLSILIGVMARLCGASGYILLLPVFVMLVTYGVYKWKTKAHMPTEGFTSLFDDAVQYNKHPNVPDALQHEYPPAQQLRANTTGAPSEPETPAQRVGCCCLPPTQTNPFGNVMITEMQRPRHRACSRQDTPNHQQKVASAFRSTQNISPTDVFSTHASQRQFFTMPWTTVPNDDSGDFGNWLYDTPPILKEQALVFSPV